MWRPNRFVITNQSDNDTTHTMEAAIDTLVERIAARKKAAGQA